ncbi:unnamed protein product [Ilex paraguariensis]|uniref:TF-B3 domain-containing protein n=1 Tax=Ilex paraguariensis TaxID=185542 RepID=A0ABC8S0M3_9AQUA
METERVNEKIIIKQRCETHQINVGKDQEEPMALSHCSSLSKPNHPTDSSPMIKQKPSLEAQKRMVPRKPKCLKSKAKQVVSDKPRNPGRYERKRTRRARFDDLYDNIEAKFTVMERAGVVLENLDAESPSFVKCMLPSNVAHGFWLILPKKFCNLHLPSYDATVILVDECGDEYETKYLLGRHGLSGGWRAFSISHRLRKGDLLVFHLVGTCKLKVHIVRVYGLDEVDAALCLINLDAYAKRTGSDYVQKGSKVRRKAKKWDEPFPLDICQPQGNIQKICTRVSSTNSGLEADRPENNSIGFGSQVFEGMQILGSNFMSRIEQILMNPDMFHCIF